MSTNKSIRLMSDMVVFTKVVELGNFSAAARYYATTPSAISRAVTRLEKALGTCLLLRTTRKLRLSETGQAVYERCVDMVNAADAAMAVSGHLHQEPQGRIKISVPKAVGRFLIHPHIPDFLALYPKVDVHLQLDDRYVDLIDDQIDLALRITDQPPLGLMGRRLLSITHQLYATPVYLARHGHPRHPHDLKNHSCICLGEVPGDSRWKLQQNNKAITVSVGGRYAANHTGVRLDAVLQHIGIGSLPSFTAKHALQQGKLVQILADWEFKTHYCGDLWVLYSSTRHLSPKLKVFVEFLTTRLTQQGAVSDPDSVIGRPPRYDEEPAVS